MDLVPIYTNFSQYENQKAHMAMVPTMRQALHGYEPQVTRRKDTTRRMFTQEKISELHSTPFYLVQNYKARFYELSLKFQHLSKGLLSYDTSFLPFLNSPFLVPINVDNKANSYL